MKLSLVVSALGLAASSIAFAGSSSNDTDAIRNVFKQGADAWNNHDAVAFAQTWSETGDLIDPYAAHATGREEIAALMGRQFDTTFAGSTATVTVESVRFLAGDVALADVDWRVDDMLAADGSRVPESHFHVVSVLKKTGNAWLEESVRAYVFLPQKIQ